MKTKKPDDLHDPRFDAAWHAASHEEPPTALDDSILAAARRAVGAGPQRSESSEHASSGLVSRVPEATSPERWWWPLAAAATIGAIAFGLLQLKPAENGSAGTVSDMPANATRQAPAPAQVPAPAPSRAPEPESARPTESRGAPAENPSHPTPSPPMRNEAAPERLADASPAAGSLAARGSAASPRENVSSSPPAPPVEGAAETRPMPTTLAEGKQAVATASDERSVETRARDGARLPIVDWITRIRRMRDEGRFDDVSKELAAFRLAYPDHEQRLPADLRDWRAPTR
jgi:hypothetical protein